MASQGKLKNVHAVASADSLAGFLVTEKDALHVLMFKAEWDEPSKAGGSLDVALTKLAELHPGVLFGKVEAEEAVEVTEQFDVSVVPTFVFLKSTTIIDRLEGADVGELTARVDRLKAAPVPSSATGSAGAAAAGGAGGAGMGSVPKAVAELTERLKGLVNAAPVMVFIKGSPEEPKCKFSRQLVAILKEARCSYGSFDVLSSEAVRQGLKEFSNWPTFPQLYVNGSLVGGVDIVQELKESGELASVLPAPTGAAATVDGIDAGLRERVKTVTNKAPAVLLMKGPVDDPACGFSEKLVSLLKSHGVPFDAVDVLRDSPLREAVKLMFEWPTFPALFVRGALIGGLDAVSKLAESEEVKGGAKSLPEVLGVPKAEPLQDKLTRLVNQAPVVLFMKGVAEAPQCGFSARTVDAIGSTGLPVRGPSAAGVFASVNILADPDVRQGMKEFSNWPTFPQLYVKGEFIGGADIIAEMVQDGSLKELLGPLIPSA